MQLCIDACLTNGSQPAARSIALVISSYLLVISLQSYCYYCIDRRRRRRLMTSVSINNNIVVVFSACRTVDVIRQLWLVIYILVFPSAMRIESASSSSSSGYVVIAVASHHQG